MKVVITHKENKQGNLETRAGYYGLNAPVAAEAAPAAAPAAASSAKPWERHKK